MGTHRIMNTSFDFRGEPIVWAPEGTPSERSTHQGSTSWPWASMLAKGPPVEAHRRAEPVGALAWL
jgi:hypothetical protein